ncbi:hypothetical protein M0R45_000382 [Rubus argutus]|uniref:Uncharacterized protein n=1 Tax=Rubus argutus TaxID=59490 RepID=A0AAW1VKS2_RUBAR
MSLYRGMRFLSSCRTCTLSPSSTTTTATSDLATNRSVTHARAADGSARRKRNQQQPAASGPRSGADVQAGSGELLRFSSTVDDVKLPKSRLEAVINEDRSLSGREAVVV